MLSTKNSKSAFEFVKVIVRNIVGSFIPDTVKTPFSMTS